jgi:hypothetical protein
MAESWPGRGYYRGDKEAMLADAQRVSGIVAAPPDTRRTPPAPGHDDAMRPLPMRDATPAIGFHATLREPASILDPIPALTRGAALQQGYTGDQCSNCFGMRMQIAGHCMVCSDCGTTTGCS